MKLTHYDLLHDQQTQVTKNYRLTIHVQFYYCRNCSFQVDWSITAWNQLAYGLTLWSKLHDVFLLTEPYIKYNIKAEYLFLSVTIQCEMNYNETSLGIMLNVNDNDIVILRTSSTC